MSKYKDMAVNKWQDRPHANIRARAKGRANGLIGRNTDDSTPASDHVSRPMSELRDPSSFAPPPRRTGAGLAPPPPPSNVKRKVVTAPSHYQDPRAPQVDTQLMLEAPPEEEPRGPRTGPFRPDTTGLDTTHLPPPPGRRDGADGRSPPPYEAAVGGRGGGRPPPGLPPRLPARNSPTSPASPASPANGGLNQGAANRLGAAGVSVPGLGIGGGGGGGGPPPPPRPGGGGNAQMNELQGRFSRLNASPTSPASPASPASSGGGTTWAQKQAALKTASSFHKDPSSVSLADAGAAAGTANNFRQRHGDQVAAGMKSAGSLNQRYGIADKVGGYTGRQPQGQGQEPQAQSPTVPGLAGKKKPPPPPPKKKPGLMGSAAASPSGDEPPPPIPTSTRPQF